MVCQIPQLRKQISHNQLRQAHGLNCASMNQLESRRGLWSLLHLQPLRTAEPPWCGLLWIAKHYPIMPFIAAATLGEDGAALRIQKYTLPLTEDLNGWSIDNMHDPDLMDHVIDNLPPPHHDKWVVTMRQGPAAEQSASARGMRAPIG